ncbi:OLC1v1003135C2 [Oldenlandia corymbosa var. corymbosa]|uniref:OLC1v1003135C2 n=1 Tax=Oldenlandia corymbosa var. corymbosa TaxID=529605 RepID=A0AAV1D9C4_OLDCO|nr:OLC1v1003135C2 [Oldenlandia corymbosa var. corymbosa]
MDIDVPEYKLSSQLRGHEDDARGICICDNFGIATSSRDKTIRFWTLDESNKRDYTSSKILLGHTSFVGPVAWISPNDEFPEGGLVSGGMDTLVLVWNLASGEIVQTLKGHSLQVTGVALDGSDVVSSSIDCSLRRWKNGQQVEVWEAHKAAVQAIIRLPSGELVTGSSDMTLKLWKGRSCVHTYVGHTDTVRGLAVMPGLGIVSASHDGSIRLWAVSGELLMEMVGHTALVYSVDTHNSGLIVSGSEDNFAKIWKDGVCIQSIEHPGCVWDAKFLENGNIVTACSDGVVRIWTVHHDKVADSVELEAYTSLVSQYKISRKRVGGLKLEELPGLEALQTPGTSDGQTKVVREGDNGVAYAWNAKEYKWDKIGEVVDGPDDSLARPILEGIQYDYVFDVDIGDGEPIRKLPYNRSDNPYDAADRWLLKENLPLSYRQQIVEFILQNTGQRDFSLDPSFRDPFTGASAYIPGQPSKSDAFSAKPTYKHIPKRGMLIFDSAQYDGILKKISEFNHSLLSNVDNKHLSLSEVDMSRLGVIIKILRETSRYHSSKFSDDDVELVVKLLHSWPVEMLFPVIDLLRMIVLHPDGATILLKQVNTGNDVVMELIKKVTRSSPLPPNLLTSIRVVTNLFRNSIFHDWLLKHYSEIIDAFASSYLPSNKNVQLAYSTLLLNYAVLLVEKKHESGQSQVLSAAIGIAEEETIEVDTRYRVLVAIGSLMLEGLVKKLALDFDVENIAKAAKASKDAKVAEVGADIEAIVKQR